MVTLLDGIEEKNYSISSFKIKYKCAVPPPKGKVSMTSPAKVVETARALFRDLDFGHSHEHFGVFYLNIQNDVIGFKAVNDGTIDQVAVYPRMIIHTALMTGASGIILVHNHPSGFTDPSEEDKRLTRAIKDASRIFDIRIMDHLIVSESGYFSFSERGII